MTRMRGSGSLAWWCWVSALSVLLACSPDAPEPVDTDPIAIDLTTLRTGFVDGNPVALVNEGPADGRRLRHPGGTLTLTVRAPERGVLRFGLAPNRAVQLVMRTDQARQSLTPQWSQATGEWRAALEAPPGQLIDLELTVAGATEWIRPRILGARSETPPIWDAALRPPMGRPNVILYVVDTLRAGRMSTYGYARPTSPRLTELANRGILFTDAYSAGSFTLPSVSALMSSRFPSELGGALSADGMAERTLPELFQHAGYATGGFQANFLLTLESGYGRGFDRYEVLRNETPAGPTKVDASVLQARALDWLGAAQGRPFFLYLQSMDVHFPYVPPAPYLDRFTQAVDPAVLQKLKSTVSEEQWNAFVDMAYKFSPDRYDGAIAYADAQIGALLDEVERRGLADRTVVVVTADHGEPLGDRQEWLHGNSLFEELVHVPLIVRLPWRSAGQRVSEVVSQMDLAPTLLDLVGIPVPAEFVGRSWHAPGSRFHPPTAIGELVRPSDATAIGWFARQGEWKLIAAPASSQLFHLPSDPQELKDVSAANPLQTRYLRSLATARPVAPEGRAAPAGPNAGLTDEQRRKRAESLKALGYVE
jgi:arylsulfatase A-like enzyme